MWRGPQGMNTLIDCSTSSAVSALARVDHRPDELSGMAGERNIGARVLAVHVVRLDDDSVEVGAELNLAVEEAVEDRAVRPIAGRS